MFCCDIVSFLQQSKDPYFFTTIALSWGFSVSEVTRLKFTVYDVRDILVQKEEVRILIRETTSIT